MDFHWLMTRSGLGMIFDSWVPQGQTWNQLITGSSHPFAFWCFKLNLLLTLLALLWGLAAMVLLFAWFQKPQSHTSVDLSHNPFSASAMSFLALAAGFTLIITELFFLSLFHGLRLEYVKATFIGTSLLAGAIVFVRNGVLRAPLKSVSLLGVLPVVLFVLLLMAFQYVAVYIPMWGDGTSYHLPYAAFFIKQQGLGVNEHLIYPYHTFNMTLLYSLMLMFESSTSGIQTVHALFVTLTMYGIFVFCRESGQRLWLAVFLPFLFASLTHLSLARKIAYVDAPGMWFVFACVFALWLWLKNRSTALLVASASFLGIAIGTKYVLAAFVVPAGLCLFFYERKWRPRLVYMVFVAAFGSWWYVRNSYLIGNPVHPFAPGIFGYDLWDESDMASQLSGAWTTIPKAFPEVLWMPWYMARENVMVVQDAYFVILMMYFSTLFCWLVRDRLNILLFFTWVYVFSWIWSSQDPRHLMPVIPLIFVHCGAVMNAMISRWVVARKKWVDHYENNIFCFLIKNVSRLVLVSMTIIACVYALKQIRSDFQMISVIQVAPGEQQEEVMRQNPRYAFFVAVNDFFDAQETVFDFNFREGRWFCKPRMVGNQYGPHGHARVLSQIMKEGIDEIAPAKLAKLLREKYGAAGFMIPNPPDFPYLSDEFDRYFELKFRNSAGAIYRLKN